MANNFKRYPWLANKYAITVVALADSVAVIVEIEKALAAAHILAKVKSVQETGKVVLQKRQDRKSQL